MLLIEGRCWVLLMLLLMLSKALRQCFLNRMFTIVHLAA